MPSALKVEMMVEGYPQPVMETKKPPKGVSNVRARSDRHSVETLKSNDDSNSSLSVGGALGQQDAAVVLNEIFLKQQVCYPTHM